MNKSCIFSFSNVKEKVKVAFTFNKSLKPQIKGMPQTTNCDNSKRSAYIIAIDNGSNEWNCVFSQKKMEKNMAFYGYVDRKCYIMIFSWIIPKDGFICFVSSQLLMIVEKNYHYWTWKKSFVFLWQFHECRHSSSTFYHNLIDYMSFNEK